MSRLLLGFAALVALSAIALVAYDPTDPPQTAVAATDCVATPGAHRLGDTLLHIPPKPPVGLVLAFHGAGGTGDGFAGGTGFSDAADDHGFAVLYPSAAAHQFWSLNDKMGTTDLDNLRALIPQALEAACTDRVFATGVSNGGGFAARVACELDDVVAIAPVAGGYRALDRCPSTRRVSVLEVHGTADHVVPYRGKQPDYAGAVSKYLAELGQTRWLREPTGQPARDEGRHPPPLPALRERPRGRAPPPRGRRPRLAGRGVGPGHQRGRPALLRTSGRAQRLRRRQPRGSQRRVEAGHAARDDRDDHAAGQRDRRQRGRPVLVGGVAERHRRAEQRPRRAAEAGQQQRLGQELRADVALRGAQRPPQADLDRAARAPRSPSRWRSRRRRRAAPPRPAPGTAT